MTPSGRPSVSLLVAWRSPGARLTVRHMGTNPVTPRSEAQTRSTLGSDVAAEDACSARSIHGVAWSRRRCRAPRQGGRPLRRHVLVLPANRRARADSPRRRTGGPEVPESLLRGEEPRLHAVGIAAKRREVCGEPGSVGAEERRDLPWPGALHHPEELFSLCRVAKIEGASTASTMTRFTAARVSPRWATSGQGLIGGGQSLCGFALSAPHRASGAIRRAGRWHLTEPSRGGSTRRRT